jgi:hypothetical protein
MLHSCCGSLVTSFLLVESTGFTCEWYVHVHIGISNSNSFCGSIRFSFLMTRGDFETLPNQNSGSGVSHRDVISGVIILETNLCHWASGSDEIYSFLSGSSYVGCILLLLWLFPALRTSTGIMTSSWIRPNILFLHYFKAVVITFVKSREMWEWYCHMFAIRSLVMSKCIGYIK